MQEVLNPSIESSHRTSLPEFMWEDINEPGTYVERGFSALNTTLNPISNNREIARGLAPIDSKGWFSSTGEIAGTGSKSVFPREESYVLKTHFHPA